MPNSGVYECLECAHLACNPFTCGQTWGSERSGKLSRSSKEKTEAGIWTEDPGGLHSPWGHKELDTT